MKLITRFWAGRNETLRHTTTSLCYALVTILGLVLALGLGGMAVHYYSKGDMNRRLSDSTPQPTNRKGTPEKKPIAAEGLKALTAIPVGSP